MNLEKDHALGLTIAWSISIVVLVFLLSKILAFQYLQKEMQLQAPKQTKERTRLDRNNAGMLRSPQNDSFLKEEM
jgi:hypothetical protein